MEKKINIAELLKDCPNGMELDSPIWNNIVFEEIDGNSIVIFRKSVDAKVYLTRYGEFNRIDGKCVIFPKGKTTWEGFVPPVEFKDGDILCNSKTKQPFILKFFDLLNNNVHSYCGIDGSNKFYTSSNNWAYASDVRLAAKEEKQILFQAIKDNGYKWNPRTKTLEKLIEPKFKVGDRIKAKDLNLGINPITKVCEDHYVFDNGVTLRLDCQDKWELVFTNFDISKLVPFESKVLVRNDNEQRWIPAFWGGKREDGYVTTFGWSKYCVPYEGNEHLLDKTDDCDEYFKIWE